MTVRLALAVWLAALAAGTCAAQPPGTPNNPFGAHLIIDSLDERGRNQLSWARHLVGRHGYIKTFFYNIDRNTKGAPQGWKDFVRECYRLELIPVVRLGGVMKDGVWQKPYRDPDGSYRTMAGVFRKVVADLPRSDTYPLYVEIWNEPNLDIEWSGKANLEEYAQFFVEVSDAIRSLRDRRIKILNGAFALSPEATEACIKAHPRFIEAFDVWGSHPYPQNHPPEYNNIDGTARHREATLDGFLLETQVLEKYGRKDVKVMILETGYPLGNGVYEAEGFPPVDEYNRADYMMRAFRDLYPRFPRLIAVFPFLFSDPGWTAFNWVPVDSGTDENGLPTRPTPMYEAVRALAKPTDATGAISGTVRDSLYRTRLAGVRVTCVETAAVTQTDPMGNFFFPRLKPGRYTARVEKEGFAPVTASFEVRTGQNTVADTLLEAVERGSLAGTVTDGLSGEPLAGVTVTLAPGGAVAQTDSRGEFRLRDLPPVTFTVTASRDGFSSHQLEGLRVPPGAEAAVQLKIAPDRAPCADNLAGNGGFERVADQSSRPWLPLRWEPLEGGAVEVSDAASRSGLRSLRISPAGGTAGYRQITHYFTAKPGRRYRAGVWIHTRGLQAGRDEGAWMSLAFTSNSGVFLKEFPMSARVKGDSPWQFFQVEGAAPEGAERVSLNLRASGTAGAAFFDDAFLCVMD